MLIDGFSKRIDGRGLILDQTIRLSELPLSCKDNNGNRPEIQCQPTGIYTIADPNDCNAYYQCDSGTRTRLNCPERQLFDIEKRYD